MSENIKSKDIIKKFKNIVKTSTTTDDVAINMLDYFLPITNGNLLKNVLERKAIDQAFNTPYCCSATDGMSWDLESWLYLLFEAKYWQNVFPIINKDKIKNSQHISAVYLLKSTVWMLGVCGLYKDKNGELVPMILVGDYKCNSLGDIVEADGIYAGKNLAYGKIELNNKDGTVKNTAEATKFHLTKDNCVFFKSNTWKLPAFLTHWYFICNLRNLKATADNLARLTSIIMLYYSKNSNKSTIEISHLAKTQSGIAYIHGSNDDLKNKLENFDTNGAEALNSLKDYITYCKEFFYTFIGRRFNVNEKQERNINSEVQYSQHNFQVLEREFFKYLELGFKEVKEKFKIDIQIAQEYITNETNEETVEDDNDTNTDI